MVLPTGEAVYKQGGYYFVHFLTHYFGIGLFVGACFIPYSIDGDLWFWPASENRRAQEFDED